MNVLLLCYMYTWLFPHLYKINGMWNKWMNEWMNHQKLWDKKIKDNEAGHTWSTHGGDKSNTQNISLTIWSEETIWGMKVLMQQI